MSLITCPECKKKISENVTACPHCGYQFTPEKIEELKKAGSKLDKGCLISLGVIGLFAALIFIFIPMYILNPDKAKTKKTDPRTERIEKQFNSWDGSHIGLTKLIKASMNDPSSYKHVETGYIDQGDYLLVKTTFRGKNKFGGVVKNWVSATVDLNGKVLEIIDQGP